MSAIIVGIQARMSSSRLPGKVMADICGKPMLQRVYDACAGPWERVILTSTREEDDKIESYCWGRGMSCTRGSLDDVLSRYLMLARQMPEVLVRVCADAPFMEPAWILEAVEAAKKKRQPIFMPSLLHAGHWTHWEQANAWCEEYDREHAGHEWFLEAGIWIEREPEGYLMVNTQEELEEARRRWTDPLGR